MSELFASMKDNVGFLLVCLLVAAIIAAIAKLSEIMVGFKSDNRIKTRRIAFIGIFSAIAGVLMLFEVPLPFAPAFYKLDFSEIPVLICGFAYGPCAGIITELVKVILKLLIKGTSSAFVGDLANFVIGSFFILPATIIYHAKKTRKTALIGMGAGTLVMTVVGSLFNAVYLLPTFATLYGIPMDAIIGMGTAINPNITSVTSLVFFCVVPFNLLKGVVDSAVTFILYKRISPFIHKVHDDALRGKNRG